jgi:hypothetical protein
MRALVRWCAFCAATRRRMKIDLDTQAYFEIGAREDLSYEEKLAEYRRLADEYFETELYDEFVAGALSHLDEATADYFDTGFDDVLVSTVRATFPEHEQEQFIEHFRGLVRAWVTDQ